MGNRYQIIDLETWKRKEYCQIYRNAVQPQYCVSFELDVTNFKKHVKENNWSFTMAFIFAVTKCANEIGIYIFNSLNELSQNQFYSQKSVKFQNYFSVS